MAIEEGSKPHAVAVAYPMQGHMNPMIHLCKRLAQMGISVSLVMTEANLLRVVGSRGLPSFKEQGFDIEMLPISDGLSSSECGSHVGGANEALELSLVAAEKMQGPFMELVQGFLDQGRPVTFLIVDSLLSWGQDVANKFGLPRVALWAASASYCVLNYYLPLLNEKGYAPIRDKSILDDENHIISFIPGVPPLHPRDLPTILQFESSHDPGFKNRTQRARRLKEAAWVMVNTFEELESGALTALRTELGPRFAAVGPLLPSAYLGLGNDLGGGHGLWEEDNRCIAWLDKRTSASVLYISFGSLAPISSVQLRELVAGVESSQQHFLWVVRPGLVSQELEGFMAEFVNRTRDRGMVVDWAPQLQVLFHPSVAGFLSHCGWNSTLESIAMGVPLIGLPCVAEQNLNCKHATVNWKVGYRLKKGQDGIVTKEEIEGVVRRFMIGEDGMDLRIRARELREAARRGVMAEGSSQKSLEAFVEAVKKNGLTS